MKILMLVFALSLAHPALAFMECGPNYSFNKNNFTISFKGAESFKPGDLIIERSVGGKKVDELIDDTGYLSAFFLKEYIMRADADRNIQSSMYDKSIQLMRLRLSRLESQLGTNAETQPIFAALKDLQSLLNTAQIDKAELHKKWASLDKALNPGKNITSRLSQDGIRGMPDLDLKDIQGLPFVDLKPESGKPDSIDCAMGVASIDHGDALYVTVKSTIKPREKKQADPAAGGRQNSLNNFMTEKSKAGTR